LGAERDATTQCEDRYRGSDDEFSGHFDSPHLRHRHDVRACIIPDIAVRVKSESMATEEESEALIVCGLEEPASYTVEHN
jgi:hypothetical protein